MASNWLPRLDEQAAAGSCTPMQCTYLFHTPHVATYNWKCIHAKCGHWDIQLYTCIQTLYKQAVKAKWLQIDYLGHAGVQDESCCIHFPYIHECIIRNVQVHWATNCESFLFRKFYCLQYTEYTIYAMDVYWIDISMREYSRLIIWDAFGGQLLCNSVIFITQHSSGWLSVHGVWRTGITMGIK